MKPRYVLTGFAVAFIALCIYAIQNKPSSTPDRSSSAFAICKEFVKDDLRAPATAVFRNYHQDDGEVAVRGFGDGPYTVVSTVDSQNGFGALVRSSFTCSVTRTGDDEWKLNALAVD